MDVVDRSLWSATFRREQLLELLDGRRGLRPSRDDLLAINTEELGRNIIGIWSGEDQASLSPFPQAIIANQQWLHDLFAWSASYLRDLGPLSGICRTLTTEQFRAVVRPERTQDFWKIASGAASLVLCEIVAQSETRELESAFGVRPNIALSYALIRGWLLGYPPQAIADIAEGYRRLPRDLDRLSVRDFTQAIEEVASALIGVGAINGSGSARVRFWFDQLKAGRNHFDVAREIFDSSGDLFGGSEVAQLQDATAEQRVRFFDSVAPRLTATDSVRSPQEAAFALAFSAFICRPGLEQQLALIRDHARNVPASWLWLGALQAVAPTFDALSLGFGSGWRIARELSKREMLWEPSSADISLAELDILMTAKTRLFQHLMYRPRIEVEVYPMITTAIRGASAESKGITSDAMTREAFSKKLDVVTSRLSEALAMMRVLREEDRRPPNSPRRRRS